MAAIPRLMEEFMNADRRVPPRRTEQGLDYYCYSEDERETADALILLSVSGGGFCVTSSCSSSCSCSCSCSCSSSTSYIEPRDSTSETRQMTEITRDDKNPLALRIRLAKQIAYKCDVCSREFSSPQALGGHKSGHRDPKPIIPDLNVPLKVFECSICGDVYDSGPALGRHKRKHRSSG